MTNETDQNEVAINKGGKIKSKKSDSDKAIEDFLQNPETLNAIVIDSFKGNLFGERVELGGIIDSLQQSSEQLVRTSVCKSFKPSISLAVSSI